MKIFLWKLRRKKLVIVCLVWKKECKEGPVRVREGILGEERAE